jgi:hypothetical protein
MNCTNLIEIGWLVLEKIFFQYTHAYKNDLSLLWPHLTPEDYDFYKPESTVRYLNLLSGSFHVNLSFSGPLCSSKWLHPFFFFFLHFCDYLPFEEDLALYLNKLEFPSPMGDMYQVWLKLASWFWRRLKTFQCIFTLLLIIISPCKMVFYFNGTNLNPLPQG